MLKRAFIYMTGIFAIAATVFVLGPVKPFEKRLTFSPSDIGADVEAWITTTEDQTPNLRPAARKEIIWADPKAREKTPLSIV